jgi:uncharacterized LabA/DUF88 family protein
MEINTPIIFTLNKKTYTANPLGLKDLMQHARFLRDEHMSEVITQMKNVPAEIALGIWKYEKQYCEQIQYGSTIWKAVSFDISGYVYAIYLGIKKTMPEVDIGVAFDIFFEDMVKGRDKAVELLGYTKKDPPVPTDLAK